ncbi:hypothetical protein GCM10010399_92780 [Dactylosporangium fulvum]|uniref:Lipoprotein n=1 Tax=Dactylosporangium fulvum TaxID=53359 RepID=A0ABY5W909_9ACTN|nr:hypothetical protein [Dactylosporangium fulvum]UWP85845.1 hypothetical protein Dfulv_17000 [Dactylosporangium fulvum]
MNRRLIVAVLAAAAVAVVLLVSRCSSGSSPAAGPVPAVTPTVAEPVSPGGDDHGDDGAVDVSDEPAVITAGPVDAREAAIQVVVKLLNTTGRTSEQWLAGLRPLVSDALYADLADADPALVPVGRVDDPRVTVAAAGDQLVVATVPVVGPTGRPVATVRVTLSGASHRWVATEFDVERS